MKKLSPLRDYIKKKLITMLLVLTPVVFVSFSLVLYFLFNKNLGLRDLLYPAISIAAISIIVLIIKGIDESSQRNFFFKEIEHNKSVVESVLDTDNVQNIIHKKVLQACFAQEVMIHQPKPRVDRLYKYGAFLLVISVFCPIAAAWWYYSMEPLSYTTVQNIISLKNSIGELPKEFSLTLSRDWHVLAAGIAFGFLCLAAARGLLAQQSKEMKTFVELAQKARYYERLNSVVELLLKQDQNVTESEKEAIRFLKDKLLGETSVGIDEDERKHEDDSNQLKSYSELLK